MKEVKSMKMILIVKMFFLFILSAVVTIMLMPAMIFGGTKFLGEVWQVFIKEFHKLRRLNHSKAKA